MHLGTYIRVSDRLTTETTKNSVAKTMFSVVDLRSAHREAERGNVQTFPRTQHHGVPCLYTKLLTYGVLQWYWI